MMQTMMMRIYTLTKPLFKLGTIPEGYHIVDPNVYLPMDENETVWKSLLDFEFGGNVRWKLSKIYVKEDGYIYPKSIKLLYFEDESDIVMLKLMLDRNEQFFGRVFSVDEIEKMKKIKAIAEARGRIKNKKT